MNDTCVQDFYDTYIVKNNTFQEKVKGTSNNMKEKF